MTTVPLGQGAYERTAAGVAEIVLQNRWVEASPTNLREHAMLLARPGTTPRATFNAGTYGLSPMRGNYWFGGLFSDSLFVVCGHSLFRVNQDLSITAISGVVQGTGNPEVAWQKGVGYERLFISDGLLLQYYAGTTAAHGTLTGTGTTQTIQIGTTYYTFSATVTGTADGSAAHPWLVNNASDPLGNLVKAIMDSGVPGTDYSSAISAPNTQVSAAGDGLTPVVTVTITAVAAGTGGNSIATVETSGTGLTFSGATLSGGGIDALEGVTMPDGVAANSLTQVSSYVLVSVAGKQQFYWINPGDVTIDPLNFANKESSPDPIIRMRSVGDQAIIMGEASTENWYATGDLNAPFAPIEGRVYQRGAEAGTPCVVDDAVMLVGNDGVAYSIGYQFGTGSDWGVHRISNHGIEERIRRQVRRQAGLTP